MAGSYPDAPSRRIAWDNDGTVAYGALANSGDWVRGALPAAALTELTTDKVSMNDDTDAYYGQEFVAQSTPTIYALLLFPQKMEIDGYYYNFYAQSNTPNHFLSTSANTTNGVDGSWSALGSEIRVLNTTVKPDYRDDVQTSAISNVVAVLHQSGNAFVGISTPVHGVRALHLYGTITPGETPDRLLFLDPLNSDAEFTQPLDYGNRGRGTTNVRQIKVQNNSGTLTANTVQITAEEIAGTGGSLFTFSTDGVNDQGTLGLGNIGPGGSVTVYVHLTIPDAQALDLYDSRFYVNVASWS